MNEHIKTGKEIYQHISHCNRVKDIKYYDIYNLQKYVPLFWLKEQIEKIKTEWTKQRDASKWDTKITIRDSIDSDIQSLNVVLSLLEEK
jgi:hypothetical protein